MSIEETIDVKLENAVNEHKCDLCGNLFVHKSHLQLHIKTTHKNIISFKCETCEKRFGQKSKFEIHIKTVHENIRNYKNVSLLTGTLTKREI